MVRRHEQGQIKISVAMEALWKALAIETKSTVLTCVPNWVTEAETLQGDGTLGTVYLFNFGSDVKNMRYQKERVAEYNESSHRIGLQVIEGGRLELGFSFYMTSFQLTALGNSETMVDVEVDYESARGCCNIEQELSGDTIVPAPPVANCKSGIAFIRAVENFILNKSDDQYKNVCE